MKGDRKADAAFLRAFPCVLAATRRSDIIREAASSYDAYIMMARTHITLDPELHQRARSRAAQLGISLAEYIRRLVARDLGAPRAAVDRSIDFDLGNSGGSDVVRNKDQMIADALSTRRRAGRRNARWASSSMRTHGMPPPTARTGATPPRRRFSPATNPS
jgi:hypothetical protein